MLFSRLFLISLFFSFLLGTSSFAQSYDEFISTLTKADSSNSEIRVNLKKGTDFYVGLLISFTENDLTMNFLAGSINLKFENIDQILIVDPNNKESVWFTNHSRNRLFLYPTAIANEAGTGYYQNIYVFFSNLSYTPFKGLSFNLFFSNIPQLTFDENIYALGFKYNFSPIKNINFAVSANRYGNFIDQGFNVTTFSTLGTIKLKRADFTAGLGFGSIGDEISDPVILLGLQARLTERLILISENFTIPGIESAIYSFGPRFLGKRISADLGFFLSPEDFESAIPFVAFTTTF